MLRVRQRGSQLHREQLHFTARHSQRTDSSRSLVVEEDRPDFGKRTRIFKEDEVAHRTYEIIEAVIARFDQIAKSTQT